MSKYRFNNNLVSIIVPVYNSEMVLSDCIESVLQQTYQDWELIMINDGSKDRSVNMINKYVTKDKRVKLINQPKNMGVAAARNRGIEASQGRYIAFLDSDDMWKPGKLEKQLEFMSKNNYGFTFTGYEMFDSEKPSKRTSIEVPLSIGYKDYMKNTIIGNLTVIIDQKKLGKVKVEYGELEDVLTWMKYLRKGYKAYGLNKCLAEYRVSETSVSGNKIKNSIRYFMLLKLKQNLSFPRAIYYHLLYTYNAIKKRYI